MKFTHDGGITVSWGDSDAHDPKRWVLCIQDTGPGFHSSAGKPLARVLEGRAENPSSSESAPSTGPAPDGRWTGAAIGHDEAAASPESETGEGLGLSIVKRLCDMLDATIEMTSVVNVGTTFRILFPRKYGG